MSESDIDSIGSECNIEDADNKMCLSTNQSVYIPEKMEK
jgi:hypothetical protein